MISHVKAVFSLTGLAPTPKFVLLALADMADTKDQCWPSVARLRQMTSFTERTVQGAILQLCKGGYLTRQIGNGRTHTTVYTITLKGAINAPFEQDQKPAFNAPIQPLNGAEYAGFGEDGKGAVDAVKGASPAEKGAANTIKGAADAPEENRSTKEENRSTSTTFALEPPDDEPQKKEPSKKAKPITDGWLLEITQTYQYLNIPQEFAKANRWITDHPGRRMTKLFFLGWLNRIEPPPITTNAPAIKKLSRPTGYVENIV